MARCGVDEYYPGARRVVRRSAGVMQSAVGELYSAWLHVAHPRLIDVAPIGELYAGLLCGFTLLDVGVSAIQKGAHGVL